MSYRGTYEGNSLKHYRTKGSKNGYSKDPNYKPIGDVAMSPEERNRRVGLAAAARASMGTASQYGTKMFARQRALINNAHSAVGRAGLMNNSYNQAAYQRAQAKAMQERNAAYGKAGAQTKAYAYNKQKNAASQNVKNINAAKNVGTTASHPTGQPNKGDYGKPNRQAQAEARRIAGGSAGTTFDPKKQVQQRKAAGSKMERSPEQNRMDAERRRIAGGSAGTITRAEANRRTAEERRAGGFSKTTDAAQSRKSNYQALVNRRAAEQRRTGVTANQAAAEARRIAGGSQGTSKSVKTAVERRATSAYNKASDAVNEGKELVKNGKKKVKSLMKRFFG